MGEGHDFSFVIVPGLVEALFRGDIGETVDLLSRVRVGERMKIWDSVFEVGESTPEERGVLEKSRREGREYGLVSVGDVHLELKGRRNELVTEEVLVKASEMAGLEGRKSFFHTHWDKDYSPVPSGADIPIFRQLREQWGYSCRVISFWDPDRVLIYLGDTRNIYTG